MIAAPIDGRCAEVAARRLVTQGLVELRAQRGMAWVQVLSAHVTETGSPLGARADGSRGQSGNDRDDGPPRVARVKRRRAAARCARP
jgi:hypothetical protein